MKETGGDHTGVQSLSYRAFSESNGQTPCGLYSGTGVEQPMYLIFGGKEDNIKVNSRVVRALYPDARIMVKEGYNHLEYLNRQPEEYGKLVRKVLEK